MPSKKWGLVSLAVLLLVCYNGVQPNLLRMRTMNVPGRDDMPRSSSRNWTRSVMPVDGLARPPA
jgi:hypothetical protein